MKTLQKGAFSFNEENKMNDKLTKIIEDYNNAGRAILKVTRQAK